MLAQPVQRILVEAGVVLEPGLTLAAGNLRVRELELERVHKIGSHSFFVARILRDTVFSTEPSLCVIHGYYQTWRVGGRGAEMQAALREDLLNKRGDNMQQN